MADHTRCPICQFLISASDFEFHYQSELKRLEICGADIDDPEPEDDSPKPKKRGAAIAARNQISSTAKGKAASERSQLDQQEQVLYRIRSGRIKRAQKSQPKDTKKRGRNDSEYTNRCCVCDELLPNDDELVNAHIDACLGRQGGLYGSRDEHGRRQDALRTANVAAGRGTSTGSRHVPGPASTFGDSYEIEGLGVRQRVTSMLEGGFEAYGFTVHKRTDKDIDEDVDIDDDGTQEFGEAQFSEADLGAFRQADEQPEGMGSESRTMAAESTGDSTRSQSDNDNGASIQAGPSQLIIESLKTRIRQLEALNKTRSQICCLICMEDYQDPVASIQCWHVHCEKCWLGALAAKRLCPQCQKITATSDLRRIYL
ncbi:uncharacterized protein BJ171DRAFT_294977 [Polychytrium aggregatum]|uniref:uncharacterized protein n=1 Tax=Polychytrium aggregatum TaxID=110093 RepID=UPI0022FE3A4B|nr:uncharacterized protein BJ171DRAFT_294977 [Polychytrium aggregatum]KAI9207309.1 hypothetical protein BJ171DRAFT_294977 [Polychytrium aggregatum]